jgi:aminotransferase
MSIYSQKLNFIEPPASIRIADRVRCLEAKRKKIIKLQTGDPDFDTCPVIKKSLITSLDNSDTHYTHSQGLPDLRRAISNHLKKRYKITIDADKEIVVTAGGIQAIFLSLAALINPGDEIILLEPYFPQYKNIVTLLGGVVRPVSVVFTGETVTIDYERLRKLINSKTKAVIVNSPNNPSGKVYNKQELKELLNIIKKKEDIYIIADEVYADIVDEGQAHVSMFELEDIKNRLVYVNSFSKTYAMTGWRLGYVIACSKLVQGILKIMRINTTCVAPFIQRAGITALQHKESQVFSKTMIKEYNCRRKLIYDMLKGTTFLRIYPQGAFYYLLYLSKIKTTLSLDRWIDNLLEKRNVAVVPGYAYGESFNSFIRITFAVDEKSIREGVTQILDFYEKG